MLSPVELSSSVESPSASADRRRAGREEAKRGDEAVEVGEEEVDTAACSPPLTALAPLDKPEAASCVEGEREVEVDCAVLAVAADG